MILRIIIRSRPPATMVKSSNDGELFQNKTSGRVKYHALRLAKTNIQLEFAREIQGSSEIVRKEISRGHSRSAEKL